MAEIRRGDAERALESIKKTAQRQGCTVEELIRFYEGKNPAYAETLQRVVNEAEAVLTDQDPVR